MTGAFRFTARGINSSGKLCYLNAWELAMFGKFSIGGLGNFWSARGRLFRGNPKSRGTEGTEDSNKFCKNVMNNFFKTKYTFYTIFPYYTS